MTPAPPVSWACTQLGRAAPTAQNSVGLQGVFPVPTWPRLQAQLQSLAEDLRPRALKTGLRPAWKRVQSVARVLDQLRAPAEDGGQLQAVALVVDPVLGASSGGTSFCSEASAAGLPGMADPRVPGSRQ